MPTVNKEQNEKLLKLIGDAMKRDSDLREKYQIGEKFRFIRDRLKALHAQVEESIKLLHTEVEKKDNVLAEDEVLVYVYLFNAHGLNFSTWRKMLGKSVFYEYSVNRPIYTDKSYVEAFIRSKPNKPQHGYITIAVKKTSILPASPEGLIKDSIGSPVIKVKEGTLHFAKMFTFTHNNVEYIVSESGEITKKED